MSPGNPMQSRRVKRSERLVYRSIAGEHLLIDLHSKARVPYFLLTPTAAAIWERLETWATVEELAAELASRFDVGPQEAATDVSEFLSQLDEMGGLEQDGASQ